MDNKYIIIICLLIFIIFGLIIVYLIWKHKSNQNEDNIEGGGKKHDKYKNNLKQKTNMTSELQTEITAIEKDQKILTNKQHELRKEIASIRAKIISNNKELLELKNSNRPNKDAKINTLTTTNEQLDQTISNLTNEINELASKIHTLKDLCKIYKHTLQLNESDRNKVLENRPKIYHISSNLQYWFFLNLSHVKEYVKKHKIAIYETKDRTDNLFMTQPDKVRLASE